jgi:hypothetical protein
MKKLQSVSGKTRKGSAVLISIFFIAMFFMVPGGIYVSSVQAGSVVRIVEGDAWRYFKGKAKPPFKWNRVDFDDGNWPNGLTGLGYGSRNRTHLDDMQGNYSTVYSRRQFTINNRRAVTGMTFSIICDGPFIAYLNGTEVIRNDWAPTFTSDQYTAAPQAEQLDIGGFIHKLLPGKNVISVECNNDDINSTDFSFVPSFEILEDQRGVTQ